MLSEADTCLQKQQQQKDANAEGAAGTKKKKVTAAQLRVQKGTSLSGPFSLTVSKLIDFSLPDLAELEGTLGRTMKTTFPNPDDILNFTLTIEPDEGMYKGGTFYFNFAINQNFPHDPPKVKCTQKIYHPNIDLDGNVCLNILREDWKPVLNLNAVIVGLQVSSTLQSWMQEIVFFFSDKEDFMSTPVLMPGFQFLFLEPNASDPLNKEAAEDLRSNREGFKRNVRTSMSGGSVKNEQYERVIGR